MAKVERETVVDFDFPSSMPDVGHYRSKLTLRRKTAQLVTEIKLSKARMLGGQRAANGADDLHFEVMATLANGVEPTPNPNPHNSAAWVDDILDPDIWYAIYDRWQEYQASFSVAKAQDAAGSQAAV